MTTTDDRRPTTDNRQRMAAAVFQGAGQVTFEEVAVPEPGPGEVRVRLEGCGVCASNLPPFEGREWFHYPLEAGTPGHEGWGRIDAVGEGVEQFEVGNRVAMLSNHAYAEYDVAPVSEVIVLPSSLDAVPFPGEPLGCALNVFRRSDIQAGQTVAIVGVGFLGALLVRLAARAGARVIAISRRPFALEVAREFGADETIPMEDHWQIIGRVMDGTGGEGCERVIEAVGKQWPLDLAAELTRIRGKLVIAGYHQDGPRQVNMQQWNWRGLDVINAHERDPNIYIEGMLAAADAVASGDLDPLPLFTHQYRLDELGAAMQAMQERPDGFLKAMVVYD
jgi:threonine dehydrogenase-like Zn-dependent dehydrogenase